MNRREFVQSTALAVTAMALSSSSFTLYNKRKIGLQLYSLRDVILKDVKGTLQKVAALGYTELESYGYTSGKLFNMPVADFGKLISDLGMKVPSGHYGVEHFPDWERAVADAKSIGQEYMVIASLPHEDLSSLDKLKKVCELINKKAEVCKKYGIRMGYHNHASEFEKLEGKTIYDLLISEFDSKLVSLELDLYWATFANQDPLKLIAAYPGRFEQWHVKDMSKTDRALQTDVGSGTIDFKAIFAKAKEAGLKHFYIEQEQYPISPIESIKVSIKNLKGILG